MMCLGKPAWPCHMHCAKLFDCCSSSTCCASFESVHWALHCLSYASLIQTCWFTVTYCCWCISFEHPAIFECIAPSARYFEIQLRQQANKQTPWDSSKHPVAGMAFVSSGNQPRDDKGMCAWAPAMSLWILWTHRCGFPTWIAMNSYEFIKNH